MRTATLGSVPCLPAFNIGRFLSRQLIACQTRRVRERPKLTATNLEIGKRRHPLRRGDRAEGRVIKMRMPGMTRLLLSLATGAGKTIIAANLLWRMHEAGRLPKPALFICDRDELRGQAYTKLKAVFGDNARMVETNLGENAAK